MRIFSLFSKLKQKLKNKTKNNFMIAKQFFFFFKFRKKKIFSVFGKEKE